MISKTTPIEERVASLERSLLEVQRRVARTEIKANERGEHPLASLAGVWRDHPDIEEFTKEVQAYRDQADQETD